MRNLYPALLVLFSSAVAVLNAQSPQPAVISPVEARIAAAEARVKTSPDSFATLNDLAFALCRKGRDTQDPAVYDKADSVLKRSLTLSAGNYEARKLQVAVLLGKQQYADALQLATELNLKVRDDLAGWAYLVDANIALGNYAEAEKQAQWVLDLRPGNTLGFEKAAALRVLFGDQPGAVEFLDEAIRRTSPNDLDQQAWLLTQKAQLQLASGYVTEAEAVLQRALQLFPDSLRAADVLAHVLMAQGKFGEAATLFEKRYNRVKTARNLYAWAAALERSGRQPEADSAFKRFEAQAEAETKQSFNANLELIDFDLTRRNAPAAALAVATRMSAQRHDSATLEAYAWALYCNAKFADAKAQMDRALAVGVRDPLYLCHARQIAYKAGDATAADTYGRDLLSFKGANCPADTEALLSGAVR